MARTSNFPSPEQIGPFRILEVIGQGGMGTVYLAESMDSVKRKVALKLIRQDLSHELVVARFRVECQALCKMNHPNIATVYHSGTSEEGYPYLAMEYVEGDSITRFCDLQRLTTRERLDLFLAVCEGVSHAHQRMVIHRDLKPANILVYQGDQGPVPKIIDFGVARETQTTPKEALTRAGVPVGTPAYMSPEQIEGDPADLDARVDVYTLGVVLYELLVGAKPFDDVSEVHRLMIKVLDEDPPAASTRFTALGERTTQIADMRRAQPDQIRQQLEGELDWILQKAMHKQRDQRYASVRDLASDIRKYLSDHPISARPPSTSYLIGKFIRRNKLTVALSAAVFLSLMAGIMATTLAWRDAERARVNAEANEQTARTTLEHLRRILSSADPTIGGREVKVVDLLGKASNMIEQDLGERPEIQASLRETLGWTYLELGLYDQAEPELVKAAQLKRKMLGVNHLETLNAINALGRLRYKQGRYTEAEKIHRQVLEGQIELQGTTHPSTLWSMYNLAKTLHKQGKWDEAEAYYRRVVATRTQTLGATHPHTLVASNSLGLMLADSGRLAEAERVLRGNVALLADVVGERHVHRLNAMSNLAVVLDLLGKYTEAEVLCRELQPLQEAHLGTDHPETLDTRANLALALMRQGKLEPSLAEHRQVLALRTQALGDHHPNTLISQAMLAFNLCLEDHYEEGLGLFDQVFRQNDQLMRLDPLRRARLHAAYARALQLAGDTDAAQEQLDLIDKEKASFRHDDLQLITDLLPVYEAFGLSERVEKLRQYLPQRRVN